MRPAASFMKLGSTCNLMFVYLACNLVYPACNLVYPACNPMHPAYSPIGFVAAPLSTPLVLPDLGLGWPVLGSRTAEVRARREGADEDGAASELHLQPPQRCLVGEGWCVQTELPCVLCVSYTYVCAMCVPCVCRAQHMRCVRCVPWSPHQRDRRGGSTLRA